MGAGNVVIRWRLSGPYSHSEVKFEPVDGVDDLMPDGTTEPINGAYWCCSSTGTETLPSWSPYRAKRVGGVRFKRIKPDPARWTEDATNRDPRAAAVWAKTHQGALYDWQLILGNIAWVIPEKSGRLMCSEACAEMLGFPDPWRFDPCVLVAAVRGTKI